MQVIAWFDPALTSVNHALRQHLILLLKILTINRLDYNLFDRSPLETLNETTVTFGNCDAQKSSHLNADQSGIDGVRIILMQKI